MRSNSQTTSQTTCDHEDSDSKACHAYAITGHWKKTTPEKQAAAHARSLAADGWADVEGRDYCPDHDPHQPTA